MQRALIAALGVLACAVVPAWAAADKEFDAFWAKFKGAIQKNDKAAVTSMTKLPYLLESKELNKDQFMQKYNSLFTPSVKKSLLKEKPLRDKDCYMVFCGEEIFIFAKVKGKYMFTEIGVND
jgi:hypothetical protein